MQTSVKHIGVKPSISYVPLTEFDNLPESSRTRLINGRQIVFLPTEQCFLLAVAADLERNPVPPNAIYLMSGKKENLATVNRAVKALYPQGSEKDLVTLEAVQSVWAKLQNSLPNEMCNLLMAKMRATSPFVEEFPLSALQCQHICATRKAMERMNNAQAKTGISSVSLNEQDPLPKVVTKTKIKRASPEACEKAYALLDKLVESIPADEIKFREHALESQKGWNLYASDPNFYEATLQIKQRWLADLIIGVVKKNLGFAAELKIPKNEYVSYYVTVKLDAGEIPPKLKRAVLQASEVLKASYESALQRR